ncbi:MAG: glutamine-hydrolyzing GMP synthase [Gemmatimonadaceae bacterium]|nr:glutamine-hydrolyzing GMP synthase [Gemmatimonadaceae bacterium]
MGIVVLDFGGQYAHLIANRVRRHHVWAEIRPPDTPLEELARADGLILSGGPSSVYAEDRPPFEEAVLASGKPILGLCYGHQLLCHALGGRVERGERMEYGAASLEVTAATGVLAGLSPREPIWMSHRDRVEEIPPGFRVLGRTEDCPVAAMGDDGRRIYGLQFHPEVTHTDSGMRILDNFLDLCGCERDWTMEGFIDRSMDELKAQARGRKVFLLVSGGVDSTVCFLLLNRALGTDHVLGLHIDNGFMRKGETAAVESLLKGSGFSNLKVVDAGAAFLARVAGVADPEAKRLAIGEEFIEVRDRVLADLDLDPDQWLLGQGTLYTDTIESGGTDHAEVIKTHHNRVGVIERLLAEGKVVEPLSQLYKDEVRELGEKLGVPHHLVWRHPFPGPGLAVRCLCAGPGAGHEAAEPLGTLDGSGLDAELLPLRSVGVQGDGRTYAHPALLTASGAAILPGEEGGPSWDDLERASTELTNSTDRVNRVLFQLGPERRLRQSPREAYLTTERLDLLREADAIVMEALDRHGLMPRLTQMPTVLVPLSSDGTSESIVLRPVTTEDFMTARFGRLPADFLREVTARLLELQGVEAVYYDVTHKPPGTVEWE